MSEQSAYELATERLPGWERRFRRAARTLGRLLEEAKIEFPDACYYTGSGGLNFLIGPGRTNSVGLDQDQVAFSASDLVHIIDGDW